MHILLIVSDVAYRPLPGGQTDVKAVVIAVAGVKDEDIAYTSFVESFDSSEDAKNGWQLANNPSAFEIDQDTLSVWQKILDISTAFSPKSKSSPESKSTILTVVK